MQPSQTKTTYSLLIHKNKSMYIIPNISTPDRHSKHIATKSSSILQFNTPTILPPVSKEYMCFMKEVRSDQAAGCIK